MYSSCRRAEKDRRRHPSDVVRRVGRSWESVAIHRCRIVDRSGGKSQTLRVQAIRRLLLVGLLAARGLAGCKGSAPESADAPTATTASQFGGTDLAWIEINIAMDE